MTSEKELRLAYKLGIILFIVGVLSYVAFPAKKPEPPLRVSYFYNLGGKVMFNHQTHVDDYSLTCITCHHAHPPDEEKKDVDLSDTEKVWSCSKCHNIPPGSPLPESCKECHEPDEFKIEDIKKRPDALHDQCIGCHKQEGAGPVKCASCHMQ